MIKLTFVVGGNIRRVNIDNRKISMMTSETGFTPIIIDLDKLDNKLLKKMSKEQKKLMKEISKLDTEEAMAKDVIKDFQSEGWRCIKKENGCS